MNPSVTTPSTTASVTEQEVEQFAQEIRSQLSKSTTAWLSVAKRVREARDAFPKPIYERLLSRALLTRNMADKLSTVASCKSLYSPKFEPHIEKIQGWTSLYEVAKLTDNEIDGLLTILNSDPNKLVSRALLKTLRSGPQTPEKPAVVLKLLVDKNGLSRLNFTQITSLASDLGQFVASIDRLPHEFKAVIDPQFEKELQETRKMQMAHISSPVSDGFATEARRES